MYFYTEDVTRQALHKGLTPAQSQLLKEARVAIFGLEGLAGWVLALAKIAKKGLPSAVASSSHKIRESVIISCHAHIRGAPLG